MFLILWLFYLLFYASSAWAVLWLLSWLDHRFQRKSRRVQVLGWRFLGAAMGLLVAYFTVMAIRRPPEWRSILYEEMFDACRDDSMVRARIWLLLGASPDGASDYNSGPHGTEFSSHVHTAATRKNCRLLRFLLDKGASPNLEWGDGSTPMTFAIHERNGPAVKLLLAAGADPQLAMRHAKNLKADELVPIILPFLSGE
ncbi:ankyrin repeat domain-containing protein [Luteolibacter arcticus]|uniref:Ankyrin repeat domain-containing protein n=1 Tax=Luteolibacter arcticus TaxID=1581411 RepID=A0ABT3GSK0_9BACT|nr:ankyrin repeat domain-containing protein [Luteolibacter arcticus]MCW1926500.1 ankyrin repeat domain-containing protein [Luteolibacter arcticus]